MEPLNIIINASNSPYEHIMSAYVLLKSDKTKLLKQIKLGVLLYVVNIHPVEVCITRGIIWHWDLIGLLSAFSQKQSRLKMYPGSV